MSQRSGDGGSAREPSVPTASLTRRRQRDGLAFSRMDPVAALRRIAFLLERSRAPTYRVKAFRTAAITWPVCPPTRSRSVPETGTLTDLAGIGPKTSAVASRHWPAACPTTWPIWRQRPARWSKAARRSGRRCAGTCTRTATGATAAARSRKWPSPPSELGHEYQALTDHSPQLTVANGLTAERLEKQLRIVATLNRHLGDFRLLSGIECDINEDGTLDQTDELLGRVDIVVASVHSKLRSDAGSMTRRMLRAIENPLHRHPRALHRPAGHRRPWDPAGEPVRRARVFAACAEHGVAVEINSRPERLDPPRRLLRQAVEAGCLFSIDTDAHAPGSAGLAAVRVRQGRGMRRAGGPDRQHLAGGQAARLGRRELTAPGTVIRAPPCRPPRPREGLEVVGRCAAGDQEGDVPCRPYPGRLTPPSGRRCPLHPAAPAPSRSAARRRRARRPARRPPHRPTARR